MATDKTLCRVREWSVAVKTGPHSSWQPLVWGPYYTERDAQSACKQADEVYHRACVTSAVRDVELTDAQLRELRALGQPAAKL